MSKVCYLRCKQTTDRLAHGKDWPCQGARTDSHHDPLVVRDSRGRSLCVVTFGLCVCEATMQVSPELVRVSMWPLLLPQFNDSLCIFMVSSVYTGYCYWGINNVNSISCCHSFSLLSCLLFSFSSFPYSTFSPLVFWKLCNLFFSLSSYTSNMYLI